MRHGHQTVDQEGSEKGSGQFHQQYNESTSSDDLQTIVKLLLEVFNECKVHDGLNISPFFNGVLQMLPGNALRSISAMPFAKMTIFVDLPFLPPPKFNTKCCETEKVVDAQENVMVIYNQHPDAIVNIDKVAEHRENLKYLYIEKQDLSPWENVKPIPKMRNIFTSSLICMIITHSNFPQEVWVEVMQAIRKCNSLNVIDLTGSKNLPKQFLKSCLGIRSISVLSLMKCNLSMQSCKAVCSMLEDRFGQMSRLDLSGNELGDENGRLLVDGIRKSGSKSKLIWLLLNKCALTSRVTCEIICALARNNNCLELLALGSNELTGCIESLMGEQNGGPVFPLRRLWLGNGQLGSADIESLTRAITYGRMATLQVLDISTNNLTEEQVKLLIDGANRKQLKMTIDLRQNILSEAFAYEQMARSKHLKLIT